MKRRDFISKIGIGAGAALAAGMTGCGTGGGDAQSQTEATKDTTKSGSPAGGIQTYTTIGATTLEMSDISMGCGGLDNPYVVDHALDQGINYFDTAPDYGSGVSEECLGKVFADKAKRDRAIVATKMCKMGRYGGHWDVGTPAATIIESVEGSLRRLQTDHIDILMVHAIAEREGDEKRLLDSEMLAAVTKLKEQGKILYLGTSSHGPHGFADRLTEAIDSGLFAMFMPAFNFMEHPRLTEVLKKAKEKNVGVVAMKTLAGASEEDLTKFQGEGTSLAEAAFKWVSAHPEVNGLVVTMKTAADVDNYVAASGKRFSWRDQEVLNAYAEAKGSQYCRTGCGDCLSHCPEGVAVAEILRYDMYYQSYGQHLKALAKYKQLPRSAKPYACAECSGPCMDGCQFGLPVRARLMDAAERLEFV